MHASQANRGGRSRLLAFGPIEKPRLWTGGAGRLGDRGPIPIDLEPERASDTVDGEQEVGRAEEIVSGGVDAAPIGGDHAPGALIGARAQAAVSIEPPHLTR